MSRHVLIVHDDARWFAEELSAACPAFSFDAAESVDAAIDMSSGDIDVLVGLAPQLDDALLASLPGLEWVHALTTGVDNLLASASLAPTVHVSNSGGIHGPQMSELAILLMLSAARDFPRMLDGQRHRRWIRWPQPLLAGKTVCIVGVGSIAEALAVRCGAFGMNLVGVSDGRVQVPGFSRIHPRSELALAAGDADFLVVLTPYSSRTHHLIDDAVIASMRSDAVLINLSRGGCVDERALERHLRDGSLFAAALDVFEHEPLPDDSPLWDTPRLTITPHIGGMSDVYREQVLPIVVAHLHAWAEGGGPALPGLVAREATR